MADNKTHKPEKKKKKKLSTKQIIAYAAAAVVVISLAIYIDYDTRNPRCKDETDALNRVIQEVLPRMDEISDMDGFELNVLELETIGGKDYYPVEVTRLELNETGDEATGVEEFIGIVYIYTKDSSYWIKDEATEQLVRYTGQPMRK